MDKNSIDTWLRTEAEEIGKEIDKISKKIKKLTQNDNITSLDKINQYIIQIREHRAAQVKLYEMIGRMDEIVGIND